MHLLINGHLSQIRLLAFLFFIVQFQLGNAQSNYSSYRLLDMTSGLAQSKVNGLDEDRFGNIWIATRGGLSRFNGEHIINYYIKDGLLSNRIHDVLVSSKGEVIVLTPKGISFFDGQDFMHYLHSFEKVIYRLVEKENGVIWINGIDELYKFEDENFQLQHKGEGM